MKNYKRTVLAILFCSAVGIISCSKDNGTPASPIVAKNGLAMSPAQEVQTPAVVSNATGTVNVSYNKDTKMLTYDVTWNNLTSDTIVGSHIHGTARRGVNASVVHQFTIDPKVASGHFTETFMIDGTTIREDSLFAGAYYVNIHTKRYPAGEIRGQLEFQ